MKHLIGHTSNDVPVYVDLIHSQAAAHISQRPHLLNLIKEVVEQATMRDPQISLEYDMGRNIGYSFVVPTTDKDTVLYARLLRDETYTRFVKNGKPTQTSYLTLILQRDDEGKYALEDAWIGRVNPPRPGSSHETDESKPYWASHAFVLDNQSLQVRTVTKECPY